jgi:acylphosphatase
MRRIVHLQIEGRVQGVGFRSWAAREAERRSLDGWVRNRADGSVEALFAGDDDAATAMIQACRRGPAYAIIVTVTELPALPDPGSGFRVLPTER